jgi:hypothetical protein
MNFVIGRIDTIPANIANASMHTHTRNHSPPTVEANTLKLTCVDTKDQQLLEKYHIWFEAKRDLHDDYQHQASM